MGDEMFEVGDEGAAQRSANKESKIASEVVEKIIKFKLLITYLCTQRVNYLTPPQTTPPSGSAHIFLWGVNDIPTICNENEMMKVRKATIMQY